MKASTIWSASRPSPGKTKAGPGGWPQSGKEVGLAPAAFAAKQVQTCATEPGRRSINRGVSHVGNNEAAPSPKTHDQATTAATAGAGQHRDLIDATGKQGREVLCAAPYGLDAIASP